MQKFIAIGNLTKNPELTETASGTAVCRFTIAVGRNYTNGNGERETDFFNCTAWRTLAESIARYCEKGKKIAVSGSIQMRTYEDNQGNKRTAVDVVVQEAEFLTPKSRDEEPPKERQKKGLQAFDDDGDIPF